jgi:hypothetical protein
MRVLISLILVFLSLCARADAHSDLYQAAGWPQQRAHFGDALGAAQQRYRASLPPAVYQTLVENSNRRFAPQAIDQRAIGALRQNLPEPQPALAFFQTPLGRKIVAAEQLATRSDQLARNANGLPPIDASATRRLLVRHLAQAIPIGDAAAEVSLALAGVAADSLSQMIPGLLGGGQAQDMLDGQRQRMKQQIEGNIDNTLLHVYSELSDLELEEYVAFAESADGSRYYQAALAALRAGLAANPSASQGL